MTNDKRVRNNCYIPIRDFSERGWSYVASSLLISSRVDLWLPSGNDLTIWRKKGQAPFSELDVIKLIEAGLVRVGGREMNFQPGHPSAINTIGDTPLGRYLTQRVSRGDLGDSIVLHEAYSSAQTAYLEILEHIENTKSQKRPDGSSHIARALYFIDARNRAAVGKVSTIRLPDVAINRAEYFLGLDTESISEPHIRETFKLLQSSGLSDKEKKNYAIASQLVRLSIEHAYIKRNQGCNVHVSNQEHPTIYSYISQESGVLTREDLQPDRHLNKIIELVSFLLEHDTIKTVDDFIKRHELLKPHHETIWLLAQAANDPLQSITNDINEFFESNSTISRAFGEGLLTKAISGASLFDAIRAAVFSAVANLFGAFEIGSLALALASPVVSLFTISSHNKRILWPVLVAFGDQAPNREQFKITLRQIEKFNLNYLSRI